MNKIILALLVAVLTPIAVFATIEQCGEETIYTKSSDFSDSRVNINFESSDEQIDVSAGVGYVVTKVELNVDDDGHAGFHTYATSPVNNFNPSPGDDILVAKVTVKKVCSQVCNDEDATNYEALTAGATEANNSLCEYPDEDPQEPVDSCLNVTGMQTEEDTPCADTLCESPDVWDTQAQQCVTPETGGESSSSSGSHSTSGGGGFIYCDLHDGTDVGLVHMCKDRVTEQIVKTLDWRSASQGDANSFVLIPLYKELIVLLQQLWAQKLLLLLK